MERLKGLTSTDSVVSILRDELAAATGSPAPELAFHSIEEDSLAALEAYRGKTLLLNFWSPTCAPCVKLHPILDKLQEDYVGYRLQVVYLSVSDAKAQGEYFSEHPAAGVKGVIIDWKALKKPYQVFAFPSLILVDSNGVVRAGWMGPEAYPQIEERILPLLPTADRAQQSGG